MCCFHVLFCTSMHNCFNYLRLSFHQRAVKTLQVFVKKVSPLCRLQKQDFGIVDVGYTLPLFHTMTLVIKQICYETRNKLKFLTFHSFLFFFVIFGWGGDVLIKSLETAGPIWPWNKLTLTLTHIEGHTLSTSNLVHTLNTSHTCWTVHRRIPQRLVHVAESDSSLSAS